MSVQAIRPDVSATRHPLVVPTLPMKDMDGTMLTLAIKDALSDLSCADATTVTNALSLAAYLHRADTRKSPTQSSSGERNQPSSPYIEHPLRNTLRLIRWGVRDAAVLAASLLHDVVEDHSKDIVAEFTFSPASVLSDAHKTREVALKYISSAFGSEIARIVLGVSNPILDVHTVPREERNARYIEHVSEAVQADPKVFLVKMSDVNDNALGLHHTEDSVSKMVSRLAAKYLPLPPILLDALDLHHISLLNLVSREGGIDIRHRLEGAEDFLRSLIIN